MNITHAGTFPTNPACPAHHDFVLWALLAVSALHMVEEYAFDWPAWVRSVGVACSETDMYVMNLAFFAVGLCAAIIGWLSPAFSLSYPALLLLNAVFHIGASLICWRLNPGTLTAVALFLPFGTFCFLVAAKDGVLGRRQLVGAFLIGLFLHAFPVFVILMRSRLSY
jgi:hypothetical protein